jgi:hypothetical protein
LARIDTFFNAEIAANRLPGALVAIACNGNLVHFKACGYLNRETGEAILWGDDEIVSGPALVARLPLATSIMHT